MRLRGTFWQRSWCVKVFYNSLVAVAHTLARIGVTPDVITLSSLALSVAVAACLTVGAFGLGAALLVLSGILDILDGSVARITGQSSRWGALLDSSVDRIADALPMAGLVLYYSSNKWAQLPLLVSVIFGFTISYVRARAESLDVTLPSMYMRRAERLILLVACLLLGLLQLPGFDAAMRVQHAPMFTGLCIGAMLNALGLWAVFDAAHQKLKPKTNTLRDGRTSARVTAMPPLQAPQN